MPAIDHRTDRFAFIAAGGDVIAPVRNLDAQRPRHRRAAYRADAAPSIANEKCSNFDIYVQYAANDYTVWYDDVTLSAGYIGLLKKPNAQ